MYPDRETHLVMHIVMHIVPYKFFPHVWLLAGEYLQCT